MPHAEKRDGKLTGFWYGEVDLRHKGGERFRRRFETKRAAEGYEAYVRAAGEEPPGAAEGDVSGRTFASVAEECKAAGGPKGAWKRGRDASVLSRLDTLTHMSLGKQAIERVSYGDLQAVVADLERRPTRMGEKMAVGTINRYLTAASAVLTFAQSMGLPQGHARHPLAQGGQAGPLPLAHRGPRARGVLGASRSRLRHRSLLCARSMRDGTALGRVRGPGDWADRGPVDQALGDQDGHAPKRANPQRASEGTQGEHPRWTHAQIRYIWRTFCSRGESVWV
jgi:hypothetical protein